MAGRTKKQGRSVIMSHYSQYIHTLGEGQDIPEPVYVPVDSPGLNYVFGTPGIPPGHSIELYGLPKTGKTSLANYIITQVLKQDPRRALMIEPENKYSLKYAQECGVDLSRLDYAHSGVTKDEFLYGEIALDMLSAAVEAGEHGVIIFDSIGALSMRAIVEGKSGDADIGIRARIISKAMAQLAVVRHMNNVVIIFLNQMRSKIGVYFGVNEDSPGGNAYQHQLTLKFKVGKADKLEWKGKKIGHNIRVTCQNNQLAGTEGWTTEIPLVYGRGVYTPLELLLECKKIGLVQGQYKLIVGKSEVPLGSNMIEAAAKLEKYSLKLLPIVLREMKERAESESVIRII